MPQCRAPFPARILLFAQGDHERGALARHFGLAADNDHGHPEHRGRHITYRQVDACYPQLLRALALFLANPVPVTEHGQGTPQTPMSATVQTRP